MRIAITGTPGTGKTEVAKRLAEKLGYVYINLNEILLKKYRLERDIERETWVVDIERAAREVEFPENCVIDGHLSHLFNPEVVIVLRCRPKELWRRLEARGWKVRKIRENVEAEAMNVIGEEARELCRSVFEVDTTGRKAEEIVEEICDIIEGKKKPQEFDFLEDLEDLL